MQYNTAFVQRYWKTSLQSIELKNDLSVHLTKQAREYLREVGLPIRGKVEFQFQEQFAFTPSEITSFKLKNDIFIALREQYPETLAMQHGYEKVYMIYREPPPILVKEDVFHPVLIVNSSLENYMIFLTLFVKGLTKRFELFQKHSMPIPNASRQEVDEKRLPIKNEYFKGVQLLHDEFSRIDKKAMSEDDNWWKRRLFDLETMF